MNPSKGLEENLDEFTRICVDLAQTGEQMTGENKAVILLNSLPDSFKEIKAAIKYGRDTLTLDLVLVAFKSKELELKGMLMLFSYEANQIKRMKSRSSKEEMEITVIARAGKSIPLNVFTSDTIRNVKFKIEGIPLKQQ